jgi:hypothetical protein
MINGSVGNGCILALIVVAYLWQSDDGSLSLSQWLYHIMKK